MCLLAWFTEKGLTEHTVFLPENRQPESNHEGTKRQPQIRGLLKQNTWSIFCPTVNVVIAKNKTKECFLFKESNET